MNRDALVGGRRLLRLALRRDRVRIPVWAASTAALVGLSAVSVRDLYGSVERRRGYAVLARDNAAIIVQAGPGYGLDDDPSIGAILMNEVGVWTFVLVAVLGLMMTTRHTRNEEESGRAELLRGAPVGRHAAAAAGLGAVAVAQLVVGAAVAMVLVAAGYGVAGAAAFGVAAVAVGMAFAGVAAVTGQVAASSRAANGLALAVLGVAFVVRAVGDVQVAWLSWLSPIHWGQAVRVYAGERWWVPVVPALVCAALLAAAIRLADHRDLGAGLLAQRAGRADAGRWLHGSLGLAVRLHRGAAVGWLAGVVLLGAFYGVVADEADDMVADNPELADFLAGLGGGSITDAFLATGVLVIGLLAGGYAVSAVLRMRAEEAAGRVDPLLATPLPRWRWAASHLGVAAVATCVMLVAGGVAQGVGAALATGDASSVGRVVVAAMAMVPAPLLVGSIAFLICAAAPRWSLAAWGVFALAAAVGLLAEALGLPGWVSGLSPFHHIAPAPAVPVRVAPLVVLVMVAALAAGVGFRVLRQRDVSTV